MINERWHVCFARRDLPGRPVFQEHLEDWEEWLDGGSVVEGTPFLLSPSFEYDAELNSFFLSEDMQGRPQNTLYAYVRDLAGFLHVPVGGARSTGVAGRADGGSSGLQGVAAAGVAAVGWHVGA